MKFDCFSTHKIVPALIDAPLAIFWRITRQIILYLIYCFDIALIYLIYIALIFLAKIKTKIKLNLCVMYYEL